MTTPIATLATYIALIAGVIAIVAMLGCPYFEYDPSTKQQIVQFVGTIATASAGYAIKSAASEPRSTPPATGP